MRSDADRRVLGSRSAVVRRTREHNGDNASTCMRSPIQVPLYYLSDPGVWGVLIAKWLVATEGLDAKVMEN